MGEMAIIERGNDIIRLLWFECLYPPHPNQALKPNPEALVLSVAISRR